MGFHRLTRIALLLALISVAACSGFSTAFQGGYPAGVRTADSEMPSFENTMHTEHFTLKWTNVSSHGRDNISDPQVIKDTGDYLEEAWRKYVALFGRSPYTPPGASKITVVFRDFDCYGLADPPDGPIQFNSHEWMNNSGIRQPTSAHELFHKMQYAYGYKTRWRPRKPFMWFTEGTAAWAEVFVWGKVSRSCKVGEMFKDIGMDIQEADDMAMPFWIYFVQGNLEKPNNELMVRLFEKCEQRGNVKEAVTEVIREAYGSVDAFYAGFDRQRQHGFWADACAIPYSCIRGPDGKDEVEKVKALQRKRNKSG